MVEHGVDAVAALSRAPEIGRTIEPACPLPVDLAAHGYLEEEFFVSGKACAYTTTVSPGGNGKWVVAVGDPAPYRTRMVVRRPADSRQFSGTALVEWFNVTGGVEANPDWAYLYQEILRAGHGYVGISVQSFGVDGGIPLLGVPGVQPRQGLVHSTSGRYDSLHHPGDSYSFAIFSQVGRALGDPGQHEMLGFAPGTVIAMGESQSAFFLTTYIDAVHHGAEVYDGFLVHSRGGSGASLSGTARGDEATPNGLQIRDDVAVPVLIFETETDLGPRLDFSVARQEDSDRVRTWEVAGTAHSDGYMVGSYVSLLGCDFPVNDGPQHYVVMAALRALVRWVDAGVAPARAQPLELASSARPRLARDSLGNALGGVRTPQVDVPVAVLSGEAPEGASDLCALFGQTIPFDGATLRRLYVNEAGYLVAYRAALDETIDAGFLLADDRAEMLERAGAVRFPP